MPLREMDNNAKLLLSEAWSARRNREQGQGPRAGPQWWQRCYVTERGRSGTAVLWSLDIWAGAYVKWKCKPCHRLGEEPFRQREQWVKMAPGQNWRVGSRTTCQAELQHHSGPYGPFVTGWEDARCWAGMRIGHNLTRVSVKQALLCCSEFQCLEPVFNAWSQRAGIIAKSTY